MFTITWNPGDTGNRPEVTVTTYVILDNGSTQALDSELDGRIINLGTENVLTFDADSPLLAIDGYTLDHADIYFKTYEWKSSWSGGGWEVEKIDVLNAQSITANYKYDSPAHWENYTYVDRNGVTYDVPFRASHSSGWGGTTYKQTEVTFELYYTKDDVEATGALFNHRHHWRIPVR